MKRRTLHEKAKQKRIPDPAIPPRKVTTREFRAHLAQLVKDGEAVFLMKSSYTYAAVLIPLGFYKWSGTEKEEGLKRAQHQFDRAMRNFAKRE
jgi:hypothetical protein